MQQRQHLCLCNTVDVNAAPTLPAGPRQYSRTVEKLRGICKAATITIPPSLYVKNKSDEDLQAALEELLGRHGLDANSGGDWRRAQSKGGGR